MFNDRGKLVIFRTERRPQNDSITRRVVIQTQNKPLLTESYFLFDHVLLPTKLSPWSWFGSNHRATTTVEVIA